MPSTSHAFCEVIQGRCERSAPPLLLRGPVANGDIDILSRVHRLQPRNELLNMADLIAEDEPILLQTSWPPAAPQHWSWPRVRQLLAGHTFRDVVRTDHYHYLVPDPRAPLEPLVDYHVPQQFLNLTAERILDELAAVDGASSLDKGTDSAAFRRSWRTTGQRTISFSRVPEALKSALGTDESLYATKDDAEVGSQFVWLSSPGVRTHTHFDSDRNAFVQLIGRKRFTLWHPNQTSRLCPYPRLHPLWHKSRVDFEAPDLTIPACGNYTQSEATVVDVSAGDVLYVPPFYWHTVETLSPSLSLSTISRW